jgi:transaldolase / glucose-6-phosphate isomerase
MSALKDLQEFGQAFWLDNLGRSLVRSGQLARLVREDGLRGVTSNPAIFEKSISGSSDYAGALRELAPSAGTAKALYERLAIQDIQDAADVMRPVYDASASRDGLVSLEVSPALAHDREGTLVEARRLWREVGRENVMIKVPATAEGIPVVEQLIAEGVNVNVTLLFSIAAYERVVGAYLAGLEARASRGGDIEHVASVASFFVSRVDAAVDELLRAKLAAAGAGASDALRPLLGQAAIANARLAYARFGELFAGSRWKALQARGARTQRVLWASTGTKNPAYRDVVYVEELIGRDTVNTMPPATADAFRDHGRARDALAADADQARGVMRALAGAGISMEQVTDRLLDDGVRLFAEAFDKLLAVVEKARLAAP